uniref:FLYWCH-type domain-containing protein n=1 Tax=Ascaris lumbricoides TaxID=6252 RepID=A0A0M3HLS9_ASCLU
MLIEIVKGKCRVNYNLESERPIWRYCRFSNKSSKLSNYIVRSWAREEKNVQHTSNCPIDDMWRHTKRYFLNFTIRYGENKCHQ